jgi:hypothetical protein
MASSRHTVFMRILAPQAGEQQLRSIDIGRETPEDSRVRAVAVRRRCTASSPRTAGSRVQATWVIHVRDSGNRQPGRPAVARTREYRRRRASGRHGPSPEDTRGLSAAPHHPTYGLAARLCPGALAGPLGSRLPSAPERAWVALAWHFYRMAELPHNAKIDGAVIPAEPATSPTPPTRRMRNTRIRTEPVTQTLQ